LRGQWLCVGVQIQSKTPCAKIDKKIKIKKKRQIDKCASTPIVETHHRDGVSFSNEHSNVVKKGVNRQNSDRAFARQNMCYFLYQMHTI